MFRVFRREDGALYKAAERKNDEHSELQGCSEELFAILPDSGKPRTQDWVDTSILAIKDGLLTKEWFQIEEDKLDAVH